MNDERNFHIFYQLFSDSSLSQKLKLTKPSDFHYLNQTDCYQVSGVDDAKEFKETKDALSLMNISNQDEIFELLAGILHLGNVQFEGKSKEQAKVINQDQLKIAATFLKLDEKYLSISLTTKSVAAGGRQSVYNATLDAKEACYARDALAKSLYEKLFDFIVLKINESIIKPDNKKSLIIGILGL
jgi:myosin heavy subunit